MTECWLFANGVMEKGRPMPACEGRLIRAHLIPCQTLKRYGGDPWDSRAWVPVCGGVTGCSGHHGMLDVSRRLRVPRERLPGVVEELALEIGVGWWLDRAYGFVAVHAGLCENGL
jgi:hypothetical protein